VAREKEKIFKGVVKTNLREIIFLVVLSKIPKPFPSKNKPPEGGFILALKRNFKFF
jgi:hypothetical protein